MENESPKQAQKQALRKTDVIRWAVYQHKT